MSIGAILVVLYTSLYSAWDPVAGLLWAGVTAMPLLLLANHVQSEVRCLDVSIAVAVHISRVQRTHHHKTDTHWHNCYPASPIRALLFYASKCSSNEHLPPVIATGPTV